MRSVALVTDQESLPVDYDMPLLSEACQEIGVKTEVCDWKDPSTDWSCFDAVLLRSPWTYMDRPREFLAWCERVTEVTHLHNPLPVVRWNCDKRYLTDLAAGGVPTVPTEFVGPGVDPLSAVREFFSAHPGTEEIVEKPTIGAYSKNVRRFSRSQVVEAAAHVEQLVGNGGHVMMQPYMDSVDRNSETNLSCFGGVHSHAISKSAMLLPDGTVNVPTFESRGARHADEDELAVAEAALRAAQVHLELENPPLYGRVDLVRGDDGKPLVLELELCEPSLNLPFAEGSALRFARALLERLHTQVSRAGDW
ncbi:ATP-grasp domain-containing protein [Actinopolyspora mortivallis]|uniref:ATP-grasp domain-containing protein n=1 Tax=Actinopolyspora mortivallis TaxID=33906 RepID=UPI00036A23BF|nr:hypothetical protein [Actinopolyspora mortivallis]